MKTLCVYLHLYLQNAWVLFFFIIIIIIIGILFLCLKWKTVFHELNQLTRIMLKDIIYIIKIVLFFFIGGIQKAKLMSAFQTWGKNVRMSYMGFPLLVIRYYHLTIWPQVCNGFINTNSFATLYPRFYTKTFWVMYNLWTNSTTSLSKL